MAITLAAGEAEPSKPDAAFRAECWRGFQAVFPLWLGVVPFALALAVLARGNGMSVAQIMSLSVFVFAGSAQLVFVRLVSDHAGMAAIVLTVFLINLRHVLYGLSLNEYLPSRTHPARPVLAYGLTDESYGVTIRDYRTGRGSVAYFLGASWSLWCCWILANFIGAILGSSIPDPERYGLAMIFPLCYLALLLPLLRRKVDWAIAVIAGIGAIGLGQITSGGVTILVATIGGAAIGSWLTRDQAA